MSIGRSRAAAGRPMAGRSMVARIVWLCVASLVVGAATAIGQQFLPDELRSMANSSGSWALAAFLLAFLARRARTAALFGSTALMGMLAGYLVCTVLRGFSMPVNAIVFWSATAIVVGPVLGLGAYWIRSRYRWLGAVGIGGMSGILLGEGVYGLTFIADSTYPPYWWGQIVVGVLLLAAGVMWRRVQGVWPTLVAVGVAAAVAAAFVVVYGADLLALL